MILVLENCDEDPKQENRKSPVFVDFQGRKYAGKISILSLEIKSLM